MIDINLIKGTATGTFTRLLEADKKLMSIAGKVDGGVNVGFLDANKFAERLGIVLQTTVESLVIEYGEEILSITKDFADEVIEKLYMGNFAITSEVCQRVNEALYDSAGIGLNSVVPEVSAERLLKVKAKVAQSETLGALEAAATQDAVSFTMGVVDNFISKNAEFLGDMGYDSVIRRTWDRTKPTSHDTKHTDWCSSLAGTYRYRSASKQGDYSRSSGSRFSYGSGDSFLDAPKNVFARHEGCKCKVEWIPIGGGKSRKTALAKGEKDTDGVLWNTGKEFSDSRKATLRRRREKLGVEEARRILNEEWKGGRNGQAERHF